MTHICPDILTKTFQEHAISLKSTRLVVNEWRTTFESWFRVELVQAMIDGSMIDPRDVVYNFVYLMDRTKKVDICLRRQIAFELKCFCCNADANKKQSFPNQIKLLEDHVAGGQLVQGICFLTLQGYSFDQQKSLVDRLFFSRPHWKVMPPLALLNSNKFFVQIAEYHASAVKLEKID